MKPLPFILAASAHGPIIVCRNDFHQLPDGGIYGVGAQILGRGAYDQGDCVRIVSLLCDLQKVRGNGVVALDCGANIGVMTLEMANAMHTWGNVLAFEAQERLFYALCGNLALNNVFNAKAYLCALGEKNGSMRIPQPNYNKPASFGSLELRRGPNTEYIGQSISYSEKDLTEIPMLAIDALKLSRCDFIKLDVEGMELEVLRGGEKTIEEHRPVLWIEWIKTNLGSLEDYFATLNYSVEDTGTGNLLVKPKEMKDG